MAITRIEDRQGNEIDVNEDGSLNTKNKLPTVKDSIEGDTNETKEYQEPLTCLSIVNDGPNDLFFTIGTIRIRVRSKEGYEDYFEPFKKIEIEANGPYRAVVKG